jgi:dTDP-4-amino-4,6-dideoxygalactose transaminase
LGYWDGSLPVSEALDRQVLTIPLEAETDAHKIHHIADLLTLFFSS